MSMGANYSKLLFQDELNINLQKKLRPALANLRSGRYIKAPKKQSRITITRLTR